MTVPWKELWHRYIDALTGQPRVLLIAVALVVTACVLIAARRPRRVPAWGRIGLLVMLCVVALWRAKDLAWVADDAFISYRYADNLVHGNGLVFNPGDRVEGYTNFLWTLLAAGAILVKASPVNVTIAVSFLAFAGVLVLTTRLVALYAPKEAPAWFSVAALALAGNYVMGSYASSGLETMAATFFVLLSVVRATQRHALSAGLAGIAATLLHPDHLIFYFSVGAALVLERQRVRLLVRFLAPFALIFLPYFVWRTAYYGDLFPNTYYAKSGQLDYYSQGGVYLSVSIFATGIVLALPFALLGLFARLNTVIGRFCWLGLPTYLIWVAKVGGDFMLARLFVVVLPFVLVLAELWARRVFQRGRELAIGVAATLAVLVAGIPVQVIGPGKKEWHIADESSFYRLRKLHPLQIQSDLFEDAKRFQTVFVSHGLHPTLATGCVGIVGYLTHLRIVDTLGLTDRYVGRKPVGKRGRPGHEKPPTPGDVLPRAVDISDVNHYPAPYNRSDSINILGKRFFIMSFRASLFDVLAQDRNVSFTDARALIDAYEPPRDAPANRDCDVWFYQTYYFSHNADPDRRRAFEDRIVAADPELAGVESLLGREPEPGDPEWVEVSRQSFDDLDGVEREGDAFAAFPYRGQPRYQETVAYAVDGYVNSFAGKREDAAIGRLLGPESELVGDALTVRVGGGKNPRLSVSLVVDGVRVKTATGCGSDVMGVRAWNIQGYRGRRGRIEVVDDERGNWGHIEVDEAIQWQRRPLE